MVSNMLEMRDEDRQVQSALALLQILSQIVMLVFSGQEATLKQLY